jgi:lambda family phage portal protein
MAFHGGESSRLTADWRAGNFSPDFEAAPYRRILRARARSLVRDNPYAAGFVQELASNVVGPHGIRLRAGTTTRKGETHKSINDAIEASWREWGLPENASVDGHDSFIDLERLVIQTIAVDGECFVRKRPYYDNAHGFALQIIDADQIDDYYNVKPANGGNEIRGGIELNEDGRALAYHVWTKHPSDNLGRTRVRIPAEEIIHLFVRYRPNQTRGVTWFAPVLTSLKMHDGYTEAELVAARTAAAKMGFIVTKNPEMAAIGVDPNEDPETERAMEAAPGIIDELEPGQEFQSWDPQHPTAGFKDFTSVILRGIARGLGMSYMTLTGDLTAANYSSSRTGLVTERENWRSLQTWLSVQFHRRVYREWVSMALLSGALRTDARVASDLSQISWKPRGWGWIDPQKDIAASILGIQWGLDSRIDVLDNEGADIEEVYANLEREKSLAAEYGIEVEAKAPGTPGANASQESEKEDDENVDENKTKTSVRLA